MAFNTNLGKQQFTATTGQTEFDFNFTIFSSTDLKVYLTPSGQTADDDSDILAITTNYTVAIDGTLGGTVTLLVGVTSGDVVTIARSLPLTRTTNYVTGGDLLADTLDADQDYQTYLLIDQNAQLQRAIILPESLETNNANFPAPIRDAYIKWNALGDSLENDTTIPDAVVASAQSATDAQLKAWEAEAERLTADSYATEPEDVFVKIYTSNGDGTFTATNTTEYSALHHSAKSATWNPDNYVPIDGNKTINDIKTFTSSPIAPTPTNQDNSTKVATTAFVQNTIKESERNAFKNHIIDGRFDFWYEATTQTTSGYGSDTMWLNTNIGSTKTHSQQVFTVGEAFLDGKLCPTYYSRTVVSSVAGAANYVLKLQKMEDVTKLAGKTVTLSFYAKADANKNMAIEMSQVFGTGGTPSGAVYEIGTQKIALTTSWTKYTATIAVPSISGKTLGTDGVSTSYTSFAFWFDAGSDYNARTDTLGQQSGTFDIAMVQIEEGSVATNFQDISYGVEENRVYRYYRQIVAGKFVGHCVSTTAAQCPVQNRDIPMRSTPVVSYGTLANWSLTNASGAVYALTAWSAITNTRYVYQVTATIGTASLVAGYATKLTTSTETLSFDARL